jgi:hypothetical protein
VAVSACLIANTSSPLSDNAMTSLLAFLSLYTDCTVRETRVLKVCLLLVDKGFLGAKNLEKLNFYVP